MYSKANIDTLCNQWGIALKKYWGQNFLINKQTAENIAGLALSLVQEYEPCAVWELGPGFGALTRVFLETSHVQALTVFEIDQGLCRALRSVFAEYIAQGRLHIEAGDAMHTVPAFKTSSSPKLICGNLPYSVGVRLLLTIAQKPPLHVPLCAMLQQEAAERMTASCGSKTYGVSSVVLQSIYEVRLEHSMTRAFFYPYAHVDSSLCVLHPRRGIRVTSAYMRVLIAIVKAAFSLRRKKLSNTLVPYIRSTYGSDEPIQKVGINSEHRAETVSVEAYSALAWQCMQHST